MAKINVRVWNPTDEVNGYYSTKKLDVPDNYRFLNNSELDPSQYSQLTKIPERQRGLAIVGNRSIKNPEGSMLSAAQSYEGTLRKEFAEQIEAGKKNNVKADDIFSKIAGYEHHRRTFAANAGKPLPLREAFHGADVQARGKHAQGIADALGVGTGLFSFGMGSLAAYGIGRVGQAVIGSVANRASSYLTQKGMSMALQKGLIGYPLQALGLGFYTGQTYQHGGPLSGIRKGEISFSSGLEAASDAMLVGDLFRGASNVFKGFMGGKGAANAPKVDSAGKPIDAAGKSAGAEGEWEGQRWVNSLNKKMREMGIPGFQPKVKQGDLSPGTAAGTRNAKTQAGGYTERSDIGSIFKTIKNAFTGEHAFHEAFHLKQNQEALILEAQGRAGEIGTRIAESAKKIGELVPNIFGTIKKHPLYKDRNDLTILKETEAYAAGVYGSDYLRSKIRQYSFTAIGNVISKATGASDKVTKEFMKWGAKRYTELVDIQKSIGMGGLKSYSKDDLNVAKGKLIDAIATGKKRGINVESWEKRLDEINQFQKIGKIPDAEGPRRIRKEERKEPDFSKPYGFPGSGEGGGGVGVLDAPPKVDTTVKPPVTQKPQTQTKPKTETEAPVKPEVEAPPVAPETSPKAPEKPIEAPQQPKPNVVPKPPQQAPAKPKPNVEPEVKPEVEVKPKVEPEGKIKPKDEVKAKPEPKQEVGKAPEKVPAKPPVKPKIGIGQLPFGDIEQVDYGFFEMGGYWLPAAPSFHAGQWATPAYIINSGRLEYNVDQ